MVFEELTVILDNAPSTAVRYDGLALVNYPPSPARRGFRPRIPIERCLSHVQPSILCRPHKSFAGLVDLSFLLEIVEFCLGVGLRHPYRPCLDHY